MPDTIADPLVGFNEAIQNVNTPMGDDTIPSQPIEPEDVLPSGDNGTVEDQGRFGQELDLLAKSYGFSDDDLQSMQSEDELRRAMRILDRQMVQQMQQAREQTTVQTTGTAPPLPPVPEAAPTSIPADLQVQLDMLDEDDPIRRNFEAIVSDRNTLHQQLSELRNTIVQQQQIQQQQYAQQVIGWFDTQLDTLGSELYGNGSTRSPVQTKNRSEVYDTFRRLVEFDLAAGREPQWDLYLTRSRNGVHGVTKQLPEDKRRAELIRERSMRRSAAGRAKGSPTATQTGGTYKRLSDDPDLMDKVNEIANRAYD